VKSNIDDSDMEDETDLEDEDAESLGLEDSENDDEEDSLMDEEDDSMIFDEEEDEEGSLFDSSAGSFIKILILHNKSVSSEWILVGTLESMCSYP
jgi:hypothetical protein